MKKIVCLLLCLMFLAVFASCVDPNENNDSTATTEQSTVFDTDASTEGKESTAETDENDGWTNIY